jgi:hypothetical protein
MVDLVSMGPRRGPSHFAPIFYISSILNFLESAAHILCHGRYAYREILSEER